MSGIRRSPSHGSAALWIGTLVTLAACSADPTAAWPPPPANTEEAEVIEAARRAVRQIDGWDQSLFVVERSGREWRVQAWKVVHPQARGRSRCAPWAVRGITIADDHSVVSYRNHL